ncbi:ATP-binding protein [Magnetococcales bacterium HHB-1]
MKLRLLPKTLAWQLILTIFAVAAVTLITTVIVLLDERREAVYDAGGVQAVQRMTAIVHLLETLPAEARQETIALLETPLQQIALVEDHRSARQSAQAKRNIRTQRMRQILKRFLGEKRSVEVYLEMALEKLAWHDKKNKPPILTEKTEVSVKKRDEVTAVAEPYPAPTNPWSLFLPLPPSGRHLGQPDYYRYRDRSVNSPPWWHNDLRFSESPEQAPRSQLPHAVNRLPMGEPAFPQRRWMPPYPPPWPMPPGYQKGGPESPYQGYLPFIFSAPEMALKPLNMAEKEPQPVEEVPSKLEIKTSPEEIKSWQRAQSMDYKQKSIFYVRIQLNNGQWVIFLNTIPHELFIWPQHLFWIFIGLLILIAGLALIAVHQALRPLTLLAQAAHELGENIQRSPLPIRGACEVRQAAGAFNRMQGRILGYIQERTRLLAALSHDLKTPITRMRLRVEMLRDAKTRTPLINNLNELEQMATVVLDYIRGVEGMEKKQPTDLPAMLDILQEEFLEMGADVAIMAPDHLVTVVMPQSLKRAVENLLRNAVLYAEKPEVVLRSSAKVIEIIVLDQGPGIPEKDLVHVLEPFTRLEVSRNRETGGTGLGLSIAQGIAQAHGGALTLHNRVTSDDYAFSRGLAARITLPLVCATETEPVDSRQRR